ncbi:sigma-70 family RNA polymerase sigma factor [Roseomonas hellenica]|nr:sigma-70 family RNA polymerase sigma factor [Plastoroseomonas hellenica]
MSRGGGPLRGRMQPRPDPTGIFDLRYKAFLETVSHLRTRLHRYCARMTGSALDGEDAMQEALFEAYRKIEALEDPGALRAWMFRIAHNRCIDMLRKRAARERAEMAYAEEDVALPVEPAGAGHAIERLVVHLPPKERASVLLKDVFDHSLEEIADLVGSTAGGVKAALSRGRAKLAALPAEPAAVPEIRRDPDLEKLLRHYVALFNRRDWDGVRALISADAQLRVADCFKGRLADSPYFSEYAKLGMAWRLAVGAIDGEPVVIVLKPGRDGWEPAYPVRIQARDGIIDGISDYYPCPWMMPAADIILLAEPEPERSP